MDGGDGEGFVQDRGLIEGEKDQAEDGRRLLVRIRLEVCLDSDNER